MWNWWKWERRWRFWWKRNGGQVDALAFAAIVVAFYTYWILTGQIRW